MTTTATTQKQKTKSKKTEHAALTKTAHRTGAFVWFELKTKDVAAARAFYGAVVGWTTKDTPMGDFVYTELVAGGASVGGLLPTDAPRASTLAYLSVDDVDACVARAKKTGAQIVEPAFDVPTVGRMCTVKLVDGALLSFLKAEQGDAPEASHDGSIAWFEHWSSDVEGALAFYRGTTNQRAASMDMGGAPYHVLHAPGVSSSTKDGGLFGLMPAPMGAPSCVVPYVQTSSVDETLVRVTTHGGQILAPAMDVDGIGRIAVCADPQGGVFGLFTPPRA